MKDRLVQTRVPERLESVLKEEARRRRLTVSHLIRNVLEDTLNLVDTVVLGAGEIVDTAGGIADQLKRDAGRITGSVRDVARRPPAEKGGKGAPAEAAQKAAPAAPAAAAPDLDAVLAWNKVVVNRPALCARCGTELGRGSEAHLGLTGDPSMPPMWLCGTCVGEL